MAAVQIENKSLKVAFTFGLFKIQIMWTQVPEEGFSMNVEQNGTEWDTGKRCFHLPKVFGTGVHSWV